VIVFDTNSNTFLTVTPRSLEVVFLSPSVAIIVLRIAAEKDRTKKDSVEEIRAIVSSQSKASFKINLIAVASVAEKDAFTSPTPTLTGDSRVGE
jgi:hypothetical protein